MRVWTAGERVVALRAYDVLDTPPEAAFEDIVEIARTLTGAPIALVSLLDGDRQWFKAVRGADLRETPLATSFCMLAADADADILVIPDATADPRTANMDVVTGGPCVRSYAGAVLRAAGGVPIGSVCVLDVQPRDFSEDVVASLRALARQTTAHLELRRAAAERQAVTAALRETNLGRELAMQAARLGRWDHHPHLGERFYDARAREIFGLAAADDISPAAVLAAIHPDDRVGVAEALAAVLSPSRVGAFDVQFRIGPQARWVSCVGRTLFEDGVCTRFFGVVEDITERRRLEDQRAYLAEELNHRVKNILALAHSVADSTLRTAGGVREARDALGPRLQALGRAHDVLLREDWTAAQLADVATATVVAAFAERERVELDGPPVALGSAAALQLSLALHELTTNASKYGALSNDTGRVRLSWSVDDGDGDPAARRLRLSWVERGGPPVSQPGKAGFGSRVVGRATEAAFGGVVEMDYAPAGLRWTVIAPLTGLEPSSPT